MLRVQTLQNLQNSENLKHEMWLDQIMRRDYFIKLHDYLQILRRRNFFLRKFSSGEIIKFSSGVQSCAEHRNDISFRIVPH